MTFIGCLVWILFLCFSSTLSASQKTLYACEGENAHLNCSDGQFIHVIRANYGRFTVLKCNPQGTDWTNTQCISGTSLGEMKRRCENRQDCLVPVNIDTFGDPCETTYKYLEVGYNCSDTRVTTEAPTSTNPPPLWSPTTESSGTNTISMKFEKIETKSQTHAPIEEVSTTRPFTESPTKPQVCPEVTVRNVVWPITDVGHSSKQPCPNNPQKYAMWECGNEGYWIPTNPDLSLCQSQWAQIISTAQTKSDKSDLEITSALKKETTNNLLYGGDTISVTNTLKEMIDETEAHMLEKTHIDDKEQHLKDIKEINENVVEIVNNLLKEQNLPSWNDLPSEKKIEYSTIVVDAVEKAGTILAESMEFGDETMTKISPNILLEVTVVPVARYVKFPSTSLYGLSPNSVQVPKTILQGKEDKDTAKLVFASYDKLSDYMVPNDRYERLSNGDTVSIQRLVVSRVLTASVTGVTRVTSNEPVIITFRTEKNDSLSNAVCVWWDNRQGKYGQWSSNGCMVTKHNNTHTVCACDHLTNFAVLMDVHGVEMDIEDEIALSLITYIGCVISIACLLITLVAFCIYGGPHPDRVLIHKNLCFCLMLAELLFIFGIPQVHWKLPCMVIAALLHYFFLAAFAWMLLEGYQLYALLVRVFKNRTEMEDWQKVCCYLFAYGMPLIIVGISLAIDYRGYGTNRHCWLRTDNYFVLAFVGPVIVVLLANTVFLVMTFAIVCQHRSKELGGFNRCKHDPNLLNDVRVWLKGATALVVLLGLTWVFGLLYLNKSTVLWAYVFTVLNSLQGLFIFIFHVVLNKKMRRQYSRFVSRKAPINIPGFMKSYAFEDALKAGYVPGGRGPGGNLIHDYPSSPLSSPIPTSTTSTDSNSIPQSFHGKISSPTVYPRYNSTAPLLMKPELYDPYEYDYGYQDVVPDSNDADFEASRSHASPMLPAPRPPPNFPPPAPPYYEICSNSSTSPRQESLSPKLSDDSAYSEEGSSFSRPAFHVFVEQHKNRPESGNDFIVRDFNSPDYPDNSPRLSRPMQRTTMYEIPKSACSPPLAYRNDGAFV